MNSTDPIARALAAVPHISPGTESRTAPDGRVHLRRPATPIHPLLRWWRTRGHVRVQLDERGSWFWQQIDGQTSLARIAQRMASIHAIPADAAAQATVAFTRSLMLRHFIHLTTPAASAPTRQPTMP